VSTGVLQCVAVGCSVLQWRAHVPGFRHLAASLSIVLYHTYFIEIRLIKRPWNRFQVEYKEGYVLSKEECIVSMRYTA